MNQAIEFIMRPHSLKLRIDAKRLRMTITASLPVDPDDDIQATLEGKAAEYALLMTHTAAIQPCGENPDVAALARWFADDDDVMRHFDGFIALPDVLLVAWWEAYEKADEPLTIATKPPHLLTDDERAKLNDPKAPKPKPVGESLPTG